MKKKHALITVILAFSFNLGYSQKTGDFNLYTQLNPILNSSKSISSDPQFGRMKALNLNIGAGIEMDYQLNKILSFGLYLKYYQRGQSLVQNSSRAFGNINSSAHINYQYTCFDYGLLTKLKIKKDFSLVMGLGYSKFHLSSYQSGYYVSSNFNNQISELNFDYRYKSINFNDNTKMFTPLIGFRQKFKINKIGNFETGALLIIPTKDMPQYDYTQTIRTSNNEFKNQVNFQSRQYSIELSILYRILNYNHPKRTRGRQLSCPTNDF